MIWVSHLWILPESRETPVTALCKHETFCFCLFSYSAWIRFIEDVRIDRSLPYPPSCKLIQAAPLDGLTCSKTTLPLPSAFIKLLINKISIFRIRLVEVSALGSDDLRTNVEPILKTKSHFFLLLEFQFYKKYCLIFRLDLQLFCF